MKLEDCKIGDTTQLEPYKYGVVDALKNEVSKSNCPDIPLKEIGEKATKARWDIINRCIAVLEGETTKNKPFTDKMLGIAKRIFYATETAKPAQDINHEEFDISQLQVYENIEQPPLEGEKKCNCSMQDLMREGCKCGGK